MLKEHKTSEKFRFIEDFPDYREKETERRGEAARNGEEYEPEYPKTVETKFFGKRKLHQIARVEWRESEVTIEREKETEDGKIEKYEEVKTYYEEVTGELGGWLESMDNLSQQGKCWVETDGYVVEGAHIGGDAIIKGGAEIGGEAKVRNKVVVDGPVGIGGYAQLLDEAKVEGESRMAVFGNAVVSGKGKVLGEAKVYGDAKLWTMGGEHWYDEADKWRLMFAKWNIEWQPPYEAEVSGKSRIYGEAVVSGTVRGKSMVYGNAEVRGVVDGNAEVGGDAYLGETAKATGDVFVFTGKTEGEIRGEGIVGYSDFALGHGSTFEMKAEEGTEEKLKELKAWHEKAMADEMSEETVKEIDKVEDREVVPYGGKVRTLMIGDGCTVSKTAFEGDVNLSYVTITDSEVKDSSIGPEYAWNGGFVENCTIKGSQLYYVRLKDCTLEHVLTARKVPITVEGSELKESTFLKTCVYMFHCYMKFATIATITIEDEDISNGYVCESKSHAGYLPEWKKWRRLFSSRKPDGDDIPYFENLQHFYEYVYQFENKKDKAKAEKKLWKSRGTSFGGTKGYASLYEFKEYYERALERRGWLETYIYWAEEYIKKFDTTDDSTEADSTVGGLPEEGGLEEGDENEEATQKVSIERMRAVYLLLLYLTSIRNLPLSRMDEDSFGRVKEAVEKTLESFDNERFVPDYDFGEIKIDPGIEELEKKYLVVFDPDFSDIRDAADLKSAIRFYGSLRY